MEKTYKEISQEQEDEEQERYLSEWRKRALYKNQEGYHDPTAGKAMAKINADIADRNHKLNQVLRDIAEIAGFEIVGRVTLKHKKSGKIFR